MLTLLGYGLKFKEKQKLKQKHSHNSAKENGKQKIHTDSSIIRAKSAATNNKNNK